MRRYLYALAFFGSLAFACSKPSNDTKIFVVVSSDLAAPTQLDSIAVDVKGPSGGTYSATRPLIAGGEAGKTALPIVVVLVPADNKGLALEVTATGFLAGNPLVFQTARLSFLAGQSRVLSLFLGDACQGQSCDGTMTCSAGRCDRPIDVDPSSLPSYDPTTLLLSPDAGLPAILDGSSDRGFDTAASPDAAQEVQGSKSDVAARDLTVPTSDGATCPAYPLDGATGACVPVAGNTWAPKGTSQAWYSAASSADGTNLVAAVWGGPIYTSSDRGNTWNPQGSSRNWISVASSADGAKLVAAVSDGNIYNSSDYGVTWDQRGAVRTWYAVASSSDGSNLLAAVKNGYLYTSADSGATWTQRRTTQPWSSVASSSDGTKLVGTAFGGFIHTSVDAGVTWTQRAQSRNWIAVASSADGTRLVAADNAPGYIYMSSDSGVTWNQRATARAWRAVASSADGTKLVAVDNAPGYIYTSNDAGVTWSQRGTSQAWRSVASSADGTTLLAVVNNGFLYTSTNLAP